MQYIVYTIMTMTYSSGTNDQILISLAYVMHMNLG